MGLRKPFVARTTRCQRIIQAKVCATTPVGAAPRTRAAALGHDVDELGAARIIAMSRHEPRQALAREFGATDIVVERGDEGVARIKKLTNGLGAHSVIEAVGTQESYDAGTVAVIGGG